MAKSRRVENPIPSGPGIDLVTDSQQRLIRSSGLPRAKRIGRTSLAAAIQAEIPNEIYIEYLVAIWQGHNAKLAKDARCTLTNGYTVTWDDSFGLGNPEPTLEQRNDAMKELLLRGFGQPAQHVQIEAELRTTGADVPVRTSVDELAGLDEAGFLGLVNQLQLASERRRPALPAAQEPVDAEIVEDPSGDGEDDGDAPEITTPVVQRDGDPEN